MISFLKWVENKLKGITEMSFWNNLVPCKNCSGSVHLLLLIPAQDLIKRSCKLMIGSSLQYANTLKSFIFPLAQCLSLCSTTPVILLVEIFFICHMTHITTCSKGYVNQWVEASHRKSHVWLTLV